MTWSVSPATLAALRTSGSARGRIHALDQSYAIVRTWDEGDSLLTDGSVTYDRTRSPRRTGSATLANADGSLSPLRFGDTFWTGSLFRLERGVLVAGSYVWVPLATLAVTQFDTSMAGQLVLTGEDPMVLLEQPMGAETTMPAATSAEDAIVALWAGYLPPGTAWTLDGASRTVGTDRTWTESDDRLGAGVSLMSDLGLEVFMDRLGGIVLRPAADPTTQPVARTIDRLPGTGTILDLTRTSNRLPYNRQIVVSETSDSTTPVYRAIAEVTDTTSPIHSSRIGVRTAPVYTSAQIPDQAAANAVAANLLIQLSLVADGVAGSFVPDPTLDEGDVVAVSEATSATSSTYVIDQVTHAVVLGAMSLQTSRVVGITA